MTTPVPVHVIPGPHGHGVDLCARQLAGATGARVVDSLGDLPLDPGPAHLHVTDRVWGASPEEAAQRVAVACLARPTTLTLHDLPQATDGAAADRRSQAYAAMAHAAVGVVVSSEHERGLLLAALDRAGVATDEVRVEVVPLPLVLADRTERGPVRLPGLGREGVCTIGLAGWFYPGKGHLPALGAALAQRRRGHEVDVVVLGRPSPGHEQDAADLVAHAARRGVHVEVTGWLSDEDLDTGLRTVDVPFVGHRNVSASGSLNSWLAAGRRPLVRRSAYFEEMDRLRPGTITLARTGELAGAVGHAIDDPGSTWLDPEVPLGHDLTDAAAAYLSVWGRVLSPGLRR